MFRRKAESPTEKARGCSDKRRAAATCFRVIRARVATTAHCEQQPQKENHRPRSPHSRTARRTALLPSLPGRYLVKYAPQETMRLHTHDYYIGTDRGTIAVELLVRLRI